MYNYYAKGQTIEEKINNVQAGMIKQNEENFKYIKMLNAKTNSAIYTAEYANNRMMNMENHMQYMIQKTNDYSQYNDSLPYMQRMKFYSINEMIYDLKESANLNISREEIIHTLVFLNLLKYNDLYGYLEPLDLSKIFVNTNTSEICFQKDFYYELMSYIKNTPRVLMY